MGLICPFLCFFLLLMIPMSLLLHSLGLPWPVYLFWSHFVFLWARGPLFLPFRFQWVLLFTMFSFFTPFYIVGLLLLALLLKWALIKIKIFMHYFLKKREEETFKYIYKLKKKRISKMYKTMLALIWTVYLDCQSQICIEHKYHLIMFDNILT